MPAVVGIGLRAWVGYVRRPNRWRGAIRNVGRMKSLLRPDSLTRPRSILAYLALAAGVATFVPGHTVAATVFACLAIVMGWGNLRLVGRVIFSLIILLTFAALAFEPSALPKGGIFARAGACPC